MTIWNFGYDIPEDQLAEIRGAGWVPDDNLHELSKAAAWRLVAPMRIPKKCSALATTLPSLANDGSYIQLPDGALNTAVPIIKKNAAGSTVWSVLGTAINAGANYWCGLVWYDDVDAALWVIAQNVGATAYLAKISDATGAITNVGSFAYTGGAADASMAFLSRAAHGSGNFTLSVGYSQYVISSSTGAIMSGPTVQTLGGVAVPVDSNYRSADGTICVSNGPYCGRIFGTTYSIDSSAYFTISRGGGTAKFSTSDYALMFGYSAELSTIVEYATLRLWDDCVAVSAGAVAATKSTCGPRFFEREDFDRYLNDVADLIGLPAAA